MEMSTAKDEYGSEFCHMVNGVKFFAMGADYIPEDNILSRTGRGRTFELLRQCRAAHFNCIRVWGGGLYPSDDFYDACDELGLVVWQDFMFACANYRIRAGRITDHVIGWARENDWRIPEHFTSDWKPDLLLNKEKPDDPFKPFGATPGHGIEWARLIVQWAVSTYGDDGKSGDKAGDIAADIAGDIAAGKAGAYIDAAKQLYSRAVTDAWAADGAPGLCYTTDWEGHPVVHDRMHWTLAEAINTSAVLFRVTGISSYADDYAMFMKYLDETVRDHENGSWFHQLDRHNHVIGTVWPGKSDLYHALQATLIPYNGKVGLSIAPSLSVS
jgi:mannose/cellobiose epimerase-like protein (N-acyl-D-glucosamine 2-epimerase family)